MSFTIDDALLAQAEALLAACRGRGLKVATAESCTGGLIAAVLTAIPGSSDVVERGFVTYANEAKAAMLGVPWDILTNPGAVSETVARAMGEGVLAHSTADLSVAVTGIAGPGGGSEIKPVGLVHVAAIRRGGPTLHRRMVFSGDRDAVRRQSVAAALEMLRELAET
ncbi:MAG: CinA family protein [Magnetospirillum sp. WYHS-4]